MEYYLQTSIWLEMFEALKFAINPFAGDTKANPLSCESQVNSRASSKAMLSKSTAESLNKYGQIGDELSITKANKDPTYERFNDHSWSEPRYIIFIQKLLKEIQQKAFCHF